MPIEMREVYFKFRATPIESASDATLADFSIEQPVERADDAPTEEVSLNFGKLDVDYFGNSASSADGGHAGGGGGGAGKAVFLDMSFSTSATNQDAPVSFFAYDPKFLGGVDVAAGASLDGTLLDAGIESQSGLTYSGESGGINESTIGDHNTGALRNVSNMPAADHSGGMLVGFGDGSVRTIRSSTDAAEVTEYESSLTYSGESGGIGESQTGHWTQMMWADNDASAPAERQAMLKMLMADYVGSGESLADAGAADAADTFDFSAYDASFRGGVSVAVGGIDGSSDSSVPVTGRITGIAADPIDSAPLLGGVGLDVLIAEIGERDSFAFDDGTSASTLGGQTIRVHFRIGTDHASGGAGDDLLIGGTTAFDGLNGNLQIADLTSVAIDPAGPTGSVAFDVNDHGWTMF